MHVNVFIRLLYALESETCCNWHFTACETFPQSFSPSFLHFPIPKSALGHLVFNRCADKTRFTQIELKTSAWQGAESEKQTPDVNRSALDI